jgi:hypothetical protein
MTVMEHSLLCEQIVDSFRSLVTSTAFKDSLAAEPVALPDDLIVVNNSFIERKSIKVKSTKNTQYLCANYDQLDDVTMGGLGVCMPALFTVDYKRFNARSSNLPRRLPLAAAVRQNLPNVGRLVFLLVGAVDDNIEVSVPLKSSVFPLLRFVPTNGELVTVREDTIEVSEVKDPGALRNKLEEVLLREGLIDGSIPEDLESKFVDALPALRAQVHSVIELPEGELSACDGSLMRRMIDSLNNEIAAYGVAIARCQGDPARDAQAFADVLRIAYNFASDSQKLITLLVSICDLKPLLLWATIAEHFQLSRAFKHLPWAKNAKASPSEFHSTVSGARNHAFHDLIRIDRAIQVQVETVSLQARSLTLFTPHTRKAVGSTLTYEDQELVEALAQFTHAPESVVAPEFWMRTAQVMRALADLLVAMERALIGLHNSVSES